MNLENLTQIQAAMMARTKPGTESTNPEMQAVRAALLAEAEERYGSRRSELKISQTLVFREGGPSTHYPLPGTVSIHLSPGAAESWGTAIYELAHETVHLLDSEYGNRYTNAFEEATACHFAEACVEAACPGYMERVRAYHQTIRVDPTFDRFLRHYEQAGNDLRTLGSPLDSKIHAIRASAASFRKIKLSDIQAVSPVDEEISLRLIAILNPNS